MKLGTPACGEGPVGAALLRFFAGNGDTDNAALTAIINSWQYADGDNLNLQPRTEGQPVAATS
jgi:hypothetical protein